MFKCNAIFIISSQIIIWFQFYTFSGILSSKTVSLLQTPYFNSLCVYIDVGVLSDIDTGFITENLCQRLSPKKYLPKRYWNDFGFNNTVSQMWPRQMHTIIWFASPLSRHILKDEQTVSTMCYWARKHFKCTDLRCTYRLRNCIKLYLNGRAQNKRSLWFICFELIQRSYSVDKLILTWRGR